jgi:hypothetical protein
MVPTKVVHAKVLKDTPNTDGAMFINLRVLSDIMVVSYQKGNIGTKRNESIEIS